METKSTAQLVNDLTQAYSALQPYADALHHKVETVLQSIRAFRYTHPDCSLYSWVEETVWVDIEPWNITENSITIPYIVLRTGEQKEGHLTFQELDNIDIILDSQCSPEALLKAEQHHQRRKAELQAIIDKLTS
jgi:hypothetical protein